MITPALSNCKTDTSCELPRCNTENPVHLAQFYSFNINCIIDGLKETKEIVVSAESLTTENVNELIEKFEFIKNNIPRQNIIRKNSIKRLSNNEILNVSKLMYEDYDSLVSFK